MNEMPPVQNAKTSESPGTYLEDCPICKEFRSKAVTIVRGHKLCDSCLVGVLEVGRSINCPMCGGPILRRVITPGPIYAEPCLSTISMVTTTGYRAMADIPPGRFS